MFTSNVLVLIASYLAIVLVFTIMWEKLLIYVNHKYNLTPLMTNHTFQFSSAIALGAIYLFIQASLMIPTYGVDDFFHNMREFYGYVMIIALLAITYQKSYFAVTLLFAGLLAAIADIVSAPTDYLYMTDSYGYSYFQIAIVTASIITGIIIEQRAKTKKT